MSTRMCIEFGEDQAAALDRLADTLDATKAGVLRYGLTLVARAVNAARKGEGIGVIRDGQVVSELIGPWNDLGMANRG